MEKLKIYFKNLSIGYKVGLGIILLFTFFLFGSGILYLIQQDLEKRLQSQLENVYKAIISLQEIRAQHIRWKVNVLTHIINEDYSNISYDKSLEQIRAFRKFNSYEVNPQILKALEENFSGMQRSIEYMQKAKNIEDIQVAYNNFQKFSKAYLWDGIEKLVNEYYKFLDLEKRSLIKKKKIFQGVYLIFILFIVGLMLLGARFIGMGVKKEIDKVSGICREIAQGNLRVNFDLTRKDEIGTIMRALEEVKSAFNETVVNLRQLSEEIKFTTENLKSLGETSSAKSNFIEMRIEEVLMEVEGIMEDLKEQTRLLGQVKIAVDEINKNVLYTSNKANHAMQEAKHAQELLSSLDKASSEIEGIVKFIRDIAEQTNLLALNASIEAARAGEAGKGFAVVATEVKELAKQTDEAGKEITNKIKAIQKLHENVIQTVENMINVFQEVKDSATVVASAVEEQTIALGDIETQAQRHFERAELTARAFNEIKNEYREINEDLAKNIQIALQLEKVAKEFLSYVEYFKALREDRRNFTRITFFDEVKFIYEGKTYSGRLRDLSVGGLYIYSDFIPSLKTTLDLQLKSSISDLTLSGEVVRANSDGFAVKITQIPEGTLNKIREFLESYLPPDKVEKEVEKFTTYIKEGRKILH
ncbi:MAG: methyl-accepting chemotaxis protein, partial [Caldimicrobium sp.]